MSMNRLSPPPLSMDRFGEELLAGAAFAGDEDRRTRSRHAARSANRRRGIAATCRRSRRNQSPALSASPAFQRAPGAQSASVASRRSIHPPLSYRLGDGMGGTSAHRRPTGAATEPPSLKAMTRRPPSVRRDISPGPPMEIDVRDDDARIGDGCGPRQPKRKRERESGCPNGRRDTRRERGTAQGRDRRSAPILVRLGSA